METRSRLNGIITFAASIAVGFSAAVAIAGAAAVSQASPTLRRIQPAPDVVRLDPVVVTVSKKFFDAVRSEDTAVARTTSDRKVIRG